MANRAGWYPDPDGKPCERYWNGYKWTRKTRPVSKPKEKNYFAKKVEQDEARKKSNVR